MAKFIIFVFAVICFVNANPFSAESGASSVESGVNKGQNGYRRNLATWNGQFPQMPQMPQLSGFQWPQFQWPQIQTPRPITPQDVKSMKPAPGGLVNGMAQTMTSHTENVGGKLVTKTQGETVWNQNGQVQKESFGN